MVDCQLQMTMTKYHIYGRKAYETPLTYVGELTLAESAVLKDEALAKFGSEGWVELVGIPTDAWIPVIQKEKAPS